ncbi:hypothetical protein [Sulfitobacter sp. SK012]|uniref:hypothetical protein n=1 Tax=Sulfitobacter sp. SK012 TaxID=1389005 RepID=UPI0020C79B1C|nr:hypothetical protein [Sulfitobacter sp. SK012]
MVLTSCGSVSDSAINPINWFGGSGSTSEPVAQGDTVTNPLIPERSGLFQRRAPKEVIYDGFPFEQVTSLKVDRVPGGIIIRATGLAARQGVYDVQLTPATEGQTPVDGVLTYRLEGIRPAYATNTGTVPTREVVAARKLTDQQLLGVRTIRVEGGENALVVSR